MLLFMLLWVSKFWTPRKFPGSYLIRSYARRQTNRNIEADVVVVLDLVGVQLEGRRSPRFSPHKQMLVEFQVREVLRAYRHVG
jgi:hypothetical protein